MSVYTASVLTTGGSATLPMCALIGGTTSRVKIMEIGIFNTTASAVDIALATISTAGTPGSSATTMTETEGATTPSAVLKNTYTSTAPTTVTGGRRVQLGASIGSGVIWTFPQYLIIPKTASAGVALMLGSGTVQACIVNFTWDE